MIGISTPVLPRSTSHLVRDLVLRVAFILLMEVLDAFVVRTVLSMQAVAQSQLAEQHQESIVAVTSDLQMTSMAIQGVTTKELLSYRSVAVLLFMAGTLRWPSASPSRRAKRLASKAMPLPPDRYSNFSSNMASSAPRQPGVWMFFLLLVILLGWIQGCEAMVVKRAACSEPTCSVTAPEQDQAAGGADEIPGNLDVGPERRSLGPGEIAIIVVAALAVPSIVASAIWRPRLPCWRRHNRRYWRISSTAASILSKEYSPFSAEEGLVGSSFSSTSATQPAGITIPPLAAIGHDRRIGARLVGNLPYLALSETTVESKSTSTLQEHSSMTSDCSSRRSGSTASTPLQEWVLPQTVEHILSSVGAQFADTTVNLLPDQISLGSWTTESGETQISLGNAYPSGHAPEVTVPAPPDSLDHENYSSRSQGSGDLDIQDIYDFIAEQAHTNSVVDPFVPAITGLTRLTSISASIAAGTCELGDVGSEAPLLAADDISTNATVDSIDDWQTNSEMSPGAQVITSLVSGASDSLLTPNAVPDVRDAGVAGDASAIDAPTAAYRVTGSETGDEDDTSLEESKTT